MRKCTIFKRAGLNGDAVFDNGQVAEYGTHAKLYAKGGIYTEMFDKQSQ